MSDINGVGYGDKHNWKESGTPFQGSTKYICNDCGIVFWHNYNKYEDIFEAMEVSENVTEECTPTPITNEDNLK